MAEHTQHTLTGKETDLDRVRPETFWYCPECDYWLFRSRRYTHKHDMYPTPEVAEIVIEQNASITQAESIRRRKQEKQEQDEQEPREVGGYYSVEISYSTTHTIRLPAGDKQQAKKLAGEDIDHGTATSAEHTWTNVDRLEVLTEDDNRMDDVPGWPW